MAEKLLTLVSVPERAPTVEDLCHAMFIEGARLLGFARTNQIPIEAQEKILIAAGHIVEGLTNLLGVQSNAECETELGN